MSSQEDEVPNELNERLVQESESEESNNGASFNGAVFNLTTTIIGAGIMALPATMKILGIVPGIVMIILKAFLTDTTIEFLLRFSGGIGSYGALMEDSFGRPGRIALQVTVLVSNIGVLIVYMIIIGDVLHVMLKDWCGETWWDQRTIVLLFTTLCALAPFTAFKRIDDLRYTSALSLVLALVFLFITGGIVVTKFFRGGLMKPKLFPSLTDLSSFWKLFTVVPVLVSAFICHPNVHNIQNELQDPTQIKPVVRSALIISSSVYIMTSLFGYLLFGESTRGDVLRNFDADLNIPFGSVLSKAVRLSYASHLLLVFPIIFYPLRVNVDGLFFPTAPSLTTSNLRFASITAALIAVIFVGANFIPNIWVAFQVTGATASLCIGFIFPAAVILKDRHNQATKMDKTKSVFVIVVAVFSNAVAMYSAFVRKNQSIFPNVIED
ncbi:Transmembrane amino acid transporter family protein [Raphanus sativus]|uniref:Amino acid transporter AVT6B n=1 Tax=Raphanus sativus TaxID=3726 RepID=A0A9W3DRC8_RAPSA|nr:amino acid transporter AVT6B [Raphanus sativus]KAJ4894231.1 Transmembrane amino acid transporter family protein [Raphanus sativus]